MPLTTISAPLNAVEEDAQEGVLDRAAVEAQAKLPVQQVAQEQMHQERPEEGLCREQRMDGAQMLAGGVARQVRTYRPEEGAGDVVLEDRSQLRVRRDLGDQGPQEV